MLEMLLEKAKEYKWQAGLVLGAVLVVAVFLVTRAEPKVEQVSQLTPQLEAVSQSSDQPKTAQSQEKVATESQQVTVDVKGAVQKPGVYTLPAGSRVTDAVKVAGSFSGEADKNSVNLAQKVADEQVVYVAKVGEAVSAVTAIPATSTASETQSSQGKINLNKATLADLQTISGIGEKRAQDILDYRDSNGGFKSVDDLSNISGIGDKTLERLRAEVTVD